MKADHITIMMLCVKMMWKYKVLSKCECCMIKNIADVVEGQSAYWIGPEADVEEDDKGETGNRFLAGLMIIIEIWITDQ